MRARSEPPRRDPAPVPPALVSREDSISLPAVIDGAGARGNGDDNGRNDATEMGGGRTGAGAGGDVAGYARYGKNPEPPYPQEARRAHEEGTVLLRVLVRPDGGVAAVELVQSSGYRTLDDSALRTVREHWTFVPARLNGVQVESWVKVPIRFVLHNA